MVSIESENKIVACTLHERWFESQISTRFCLKTDKFCTQFYRTIKHFDGINIQKLQKFYAREKQSERDRERTNRWASNDLIVFWR